MEGAASAIDVGRIAWRAGAFSRGVRTLAEEVPVAITYNGSTHAVMMATPADLDDFAVGFSLTEGIVKSRSEIESMEILAIDGGYEARMWLAPALADRHRRKRRAILGPTGCGLCGVESIAEVLKPLTVVESDLTVSPRRLSEAMASLQTLQKLNGQTRAVHAAGLYRDSEPVLVREDVGRHNALDKLIGAVSPSIPVSNGIILLTSRVSVELIQKTAILGAPIIAAVSAPTGLAVRLAEQAGITLAAILRGDEFEIFTCPNRIVEEACFHVR